MNLLICYISSWIGSFKHFFQGMLKIAGLRSAHKHAEAQATFFFLNDLKWTYFFCSLQLCPKTVVLASWIRKSQIDSSNWHAVATGKLCFPLLCIFLRSQVYELMQSERFPPSILALPKLFRTLRILPIKANFALEKLKRLQAEASITCNKFSFWSANHLVSKHGGCHGSDSISLLQKMSLLASLATESFFVGGWYRRPGTGCLLDVQSHAFHLINGAWWLLLKFTAGGRTANQARLLTSVTTSRFTTATLTTTSGLTPEAWCCHATEQGQCGAEGREMSREEYIICIRAASGWVASKFEHYQWIAKVASRQLCLSESRKRSPS